MLSNKTLALIFKPKGGGKDEKVSHLDEIASMIEQFRSETDPKKAAQIFMDMQSVCGESPTGDEAAGDSGDDDSGGGDAA